MQQKKYPSLEALIADDPQAREFYNSLPEPVKEQMNQRSDSVNSYASLQDYAENLTRGDN